MTGFLRPVTEFTVSSGFAYGMLVGLFGTLKLSLSRQGKLFSGDIGPLLIGLNVALLPMILLSGIVVDLMGVKFVGIVSSAMAAVGVFALGFQLKTSRTFGAMLLAGMGGLGLSVASIVSMPEAFFGADLPIAGTCFGFAIIALGSLVAPPAADILFRTLGSRRAIAILGFACLLPGFLACFAGKALPSAGAGQFTLMGVATNYTLWTAALVVAAYAVLEGSLAAWIATFAGDASGKRQQTASLMASFWLALLISRVFVAIAQFGGYLQPKFDAWLLVVPALLAAATLGNMAGASRHASDRIGLLILGFLIGPILPGLVGMA
ncbi:MAG: hypothetical protein ACRD36_12390, partial [Candidatus Acidiferrum sp.]